MDGGKRRGHRTHAWRGRSHPHWSGLRWSRFHASFCHTRAQSQDEAAAKSLHSRRREPEIQRSAPCSPPQGQAEGSQYRDGGCRALGWVVLQRRRFGTMSEAELITSLHSPSSKAGKWKYPKAFCCEHKVATICYSRGACVGLSQKIPALNSYSINF